MMLNIKSLREQIYEHLKNEMQSGKLAPGSSINLNAISRQLEISKTPLRDALIQLEAEGFVSILPRRGVLVRKLYLHDIKESYEIIGALEASVILSVFDQFTSTHISRMEQLNAKQMEALNKDNFENYYKLNLEFHGVFLELSDNVALNKIIIPLKQRLYDFPRRSYLKDWELQHISEHEQFIDFIKRGAKEGAADIIKDVHWSFAIHEKYFRQFYELNNSID
ncbi:MAG: GntR family transcriptional regulator [Deltaproteobacteria bacterium]|nr:GntR family transcriptional regulator [Deltaproteobacteria bacterium]MBW2181722.1 GntR family transcriptional regulator [Deltaproteobacteria bacterium]